MELSAVPELVVVVVAGAMLVLSIALSSSDLLQAPTATRVTRAVIAVIALVRISSESSRGSSRVLPWPGASAFQDVTGANRAPWPPSWINAESRRPVNTIAMPRSFAAAITSPIADRAAGLDDRAYAGFGRLIDAVAEGEDTRPSPSTAPCRVVTLRAAPCARRGMRRRRVTSGRRRCRSSRRRARARSRSTSPRRPRATRTADRDALRPSARASSTTFQPSSSMHRARTLLHEHAAAHPLVVERVRRPTTAFPRAREDSSCGRGSRRAPSLNDGATMHSTNRLDTASAVASSTGTRERDHRAERRHGIARERLPIRVERASRRWRDRTASCA